MFDRAQLDTLLVVMAGAVLGGVVGLEREFKKKPAGLRTHMLVSATAALLVRLAEVSMRVFKEHGGVEFMADPIRVIQAVVIGISFIGGGTIWKSKQESRVYHLTTAASILYTAGIGMAAGLYQMILAAGLSLFGVAINLIGRLEPKTGQNARRPD